MALITEELEAEAGEPRDHRGAMHPVPLDSSGEALLNQQARALAGAIQHARRLGVVVEAFGPPVIHDHREVKIVAANRMRAHRITLLPDARFHAFARVDYVDGFRRQAQRRATGGTCKTFLKAGGDGVDCPGIHLERISGKGCRDIRVEEHVVRGADRTEILERLQHRRRRVTLDDREKFRPVLDDRRLDLLGTENGAPLRLDGANIRPAPLCDLGEQVPEPAEDRHQHNVARLDQRNECRLDSGPRGAVNQQSLFIRGREHLAVEGHRLGHVRGHRRVVLADQLGRHRAQHPRVGIDRAGAHQEPGGRMNRLAVHAQLLGSVTQESLRVAGFGAVSNTGSTSARGASPTAMEEKPAHGSKTLLPPMQIDENVTRRMPARREPGQHGSPTAMEEKPAHGSKTPLPPMQIDENVTQRMAARREPGSPQARREPSGGDGGGSACCEGDGRVDECQVASAGADEAQSHGSGIRAHEGR